MKMQVFVDKGVDWLVRFGPRIVIAAIVFVLGQWLIRILQKQIKSRISKRSTSPSLRPFLQNLIITVLYILLILLVMQIMGIQLTIFAAIVAALGVAAGLALSGILQNFASGILILLLRPFKVGDNIVAQGTEGKVTSIQLFNTYVTTFDNKSVIFPNSKLSNEIITNITLEGSRRLDIELKFNYGYDFNTVKKIVIDAIAVSKDVLHSPDARVVISSLEQDGYKVLINVWLNAHGFRDTSFVFNEALLRAFKASGLKLPGMS